MCVCVCVLYLVVNVVGLCVIWFAVVLQVAGG